MSLAPGSLQGKAQLMEQPLTLPHTKGDSIVFLQMVRQQQPVPKVLVVARFSRRTPYLTSQPLPLRGGKSAGSPWAIALLQPSQALGKEAADPIFYTPGRVPVQMRRLIGTGPVEHVKNDMETMEIPPLTSSRYFVLDGCDKCLCIRNRNPFHWEHPLRLFAPSISQ